MTKSEKQKKYVEELVKRSLDWEHDPAGVVWTVEEVRHGGRKVRLIVCHYLRWSAKYKMWGSSEVAEEEGPAALSCPLRFLDLVPKAADPVWRKAVRKWHQARERAGEPPRIESQAGGGPMEGDFTASVSIRVWSRSDPAEEVAAILAAVYPGAGCGPAGDPYPLLEVAADRPDTACSHRHRGHSWTVTLEVSCFIDEELEPQFLSGKLANKLSEALEDAPEKDFDVMGLEVGPLKPVERRRL